MHRMIALLTVFLHLGLGSVFAAEKPLKVFILAGQSNMVGWGDSAKLPDDLSDLIPERIAGPYPATQWVVKAQWEAQSAIPHTRTVILRDIETHPKNVHNNTAGQLKVGKLFAEACLRTLQ